MTYERSLAALADPTRRQLLEHLSTKALTVTEISSKFSVSQPAVSQHLRVLRDAGLVDVERAGTRRIYSARATALGELRDYLNEMWATALQRVPQSGND